MQNPHLNEGKTMVHVHITHCHFLQIMPPNESTPMEIAWGRDSRLFSAGMNGNVYEYDIETLQIKVCSCNRQH